MKAKEALTLALADAIENAAVGSKLENSFLYGTSRGSVEVDGHSKVVRVDITSKTKTRSSDPITKEQDVAFTVQCFVLPNYESATELEAEDVAVDESDLLADEVYEYLNVNTTLSGEVCDLIFPEDANNSDMGMANFGGRRYGATYIYGVINPKGEV